MTCIVGLVHNGTVYLGGDSAGSNGWTSRSVAQPKVFKVGEFVCGYTGSFRMGQLLEYNIRLAPQHEDQDCLQYMVTEFAETARTLFKDHGFATVENNSESGGQFLIGYRGALYVIQDDYSVLHHMDGFEAIGSGEHFALAAMMALADLPPKKRITRALEIAAHYVESVKPPFKIVRVKG